MNPKFRSVLFRSAALLSLLVYAPTFATAQIPPPVEYAAKFVCGVPPAAEVTRGAVNSGNYTTAINIHNPNSGGLQFKKKAVLSLPEGVTPHPPSNVVTDTLNSDFAEEVDCANIRKLLGITSATSFIKGFVVLISPAELDVVGVYTAAPLTSTGGPGSVATLEVVPVTGRHFM